MDDIRTPMNSPVVTFIMCESSLQIRQAFDRQFATTYPDAIQIKTYDNCSSTRKFNCHGYAWLRVEQNIDRWIGTGWPNDIIDPEKIYITDSSYIEVSQEIFPGKVFWASGDHTAITTDQQGIFISKWNEWPLMKHAWNYSPYGSNDLEYYIRKPSISGPSIVCSSGASFTVNNLPTGATITWSQGPNLARASAQGSNPCTFSSTGPGNSWVRATLVMDGDSVTLPGKVVWSGNPLFHVSGPSEGCPNVEYIFEATPQPYSNPSYNYSWAIYPNDGYISTSDGGRYAYIYFYNVYSVAGYDVKVRAQNACGLGEYSMGNIWVHECYDFLLSPNPATETVTITKVAANSGENTTKSTGSVDEGTIFTIRIIDFYGSLHFTTTKSGSSFTIPISNLKDGNYIVEITNGKNIINKQLVIKR